MQNIIFFVSIAYIKPSNIAFIAARNILNRISSSSEHLKCYIWDFALHLINTPLKQVFWIPYDEASYTKIWVPTLALN